MVLPIVAAKGGEKALQSVSKGLGTPIWSKTVESIEKTRHGPGKALVRRTTNISPVTIGVGLLALGGAAAAAGLTLWLAQKTPTTVEGKDVVVRAWRTVEGKTTVIHHPEVSHMEDVYDWVAVKIGEEEVTDTVWRPGEEDLLGPFYTLEDAEAAKELALVKWDTASIQARPGGVFYIYVSRDGFWEDRVIISDVIENQWVVVDTKKVIDEEAYDETKAIEERWAVQYGTHIKYGDPGQPAASVAIIMMNGVKPFDWVCATDTLVDEPAKKLFKFSSESAKSISLGDRRGFLE